MASSRPDLAPLSSTTTRSSISNVPMHEVEPSPVDDDEDEEARSLPEPSISEKDSSSLHSHSTTTNFLGLTPARTIHLLSSIQTYATLPPTLYLTLHYTNTALIPLITQSVADSDRLLLLTRPYYQSFPLEPLLIFAPIATHVLSGIALRIYRRRQNAKRHGAETHADRRSIPWPKLSLTSALGYALYPMLASHVLVNRVTPLKVEGGSSGVGLRYFAHGMAKHPLLANASYVVMLSVASWHFVTGGAKYLRLSSDFITDRGVDGVRRRKWRTRVVNAVAACVAALWIAGGLGVVGRGGSGEGWEASNWDRIYKSVPGLGRWM